MKIIELQHVLVPLLSPLQLPSTTIGLTLQQPHCIWGKFFLTRVATEATLHVKSSLKPWRHYVEVSRGPAGKDHLVDELAGAWGRAGNGDRKDYAWHL
jgi:hypothetical protein